MLYVGNDNTSGTTIPTGIYEAQDIVISDGNVADPDDVVFKGQARTEPETKKRFVNDTIRNDFHRRFLTKYIK